MSNKLQTLQGALKVAAEDELDALELTSSKMTTSTSVSSEGRVTVSLNIELVGRTDALILLDEFLACDYATQRAALDLVKGNADDC